MPPSSQHVFEFEKGIGTIGVGWINRAPIRLPFASHLQPTVGTRVDPGYDNIKLKVTVPTRCIGVTTVRGGIGIGATPDNGVGVLGFDSDTGSGATASDLLVSGAPSYSGVPVPW